uniref:Uncharacterized protein n=1 Tax=Oryza punctata TaxID=4537 RepID=A0A0E0M6V2_ORYPU
MAVMTVGGIMSGQALPKCLGQGQHGRRPLPPRHHPTFLPPETARPQGRQRLSLPFSPRSGVKAHDPNQLRGDDSCGNGGLRLACKGLATGVEESNGVNN